MSDHACKHGIERCERCEAEREERLSNADDALQFERDEAAKWKALATEAKRERDEARSKHDTLRAEFDTLRHSSDFMRLEFDAAHTRAERAEAEIHKIEDDQEVCPWAAKCKHLAALRKKVSAPCVSVSAPATCPICDEGD